MLGRLHPFAHRTLVRPEVHVLPVSTRNSRISFLPYLRSSWHGYATIDSSAGGVLDISRFDTSDFAGFSALLATDQKLSPAHISRSAAKAIKASVGVGHIPEAFIILSALRDTNAKLSSPEAKARFPLRQVSTTLVHALLANGKIRQAARFAREAMPKEAKLFKSRTIDALVEGLCPEPGPPGTTSKRQTSSESGNTRDGEEWFHSGWRLRHIDKPTLPLLVGLFDPRAGIPKHAIFDSATSNAPIFRSPPKSDVELGSPFSPLEKPELPFPPSYAEVRLSRPAQAELVPSLVRDITASFNEPKPSLRELQRALYAQPRTQGGADSPSTSWARGSHVGLNPSTCLAIALLAQARRTRYKRTKDMYERVINACLLQGEIITASLLFAVLISDWQLARKKQLQDPAQWLHGEDVEEIQRGIDHKQKVDADKVGKAMVKLDLPQAGMWRGLKKSRALLRNFRSRLGAPDVMGDAPFPSYAILRQILQFSQNEQHLGSPATDQVLGCLATLVHLHLLPYGYISEVIKALYSVPRTSTLWPHGPEGQTIHGHCHSVLMHLIVSLPAVDPSYRGSRRNPLRPLDIFSYNALLHYSLRHRLSPQMAKHLVDHMETKRKPPIQCDAATYAILLRSASLIRKNSDASRIIERLAQTGGPVSEAFLEMDRTSRETVALSTTAGGHEEGNPAQAAESVIPGFSRDVKSKRKIDKTGVDWSDTNIKHTLQRALQKAHRQPLPEPTADSITTPLVNRHTITSLITHLVSTGRARLVVELIPGFVPSVSIDRLPRNQRLAALDRAVTLGPHIFSALINACSKSGKIGLAERLWWTATKAETASWTEGPWGTGESGWWLPVEAYTTMMQAYARESKDHLPYGGDRLRRPNGKRFQKRYTRGWGFTFDGSSAPGGVEPLRERWVTARIAGLKIVHSMQSAGLEVYHRLRRSRFLEMPAQFTDNPDAIARFRQRPWPDARFFNACLELFGRRPGMVRRAQLRASASKWKRRTRLLQERRQRGFERQDRDPALPYILGWMRRLGYEVPLAFAHVASEFFDEDTRLEQVPPRTLKVRPFLYGPRKKEYAFSPFVIPVSKDRGLPVRRNGGRAPRGRRWRRVER